MSKNLGLKILWPLCTSSFLLFKVTHPYPNFNGGLAKSPLVLGHGWVITSHSLMWKQLRIHTVNSMQVHLIYIYIYIYIYMDFCWHSKALCSTETKVVHNLAKEAIEAKNISFIMSFKTTSNTRPVHDIAKINHSIVNNAKLPLRIFHRRVDDKSNKISSLTDLFIYYKYLYNIDSYSNIRSPVYSHLK